MEFMSCAYALKEIKKSNFAKYNDTVVLNTKHFLEVPV